MKSVPALTELNGRGFGVARAGVSSYFFELKKDGTKTIYSPTLPGDRRPQLVASKTQILVLIAGLGYVFDLKANTLTAITADGFPPGATKSGYQDGYFIVLAPNSQKFAISGLNDGLSWDPLDFGEANGEPGNIVSFIPDHRLLWFYGVDNGEIYYDSGNADFPFQRLEGASWEQGTAAIDSLQKCDNSIIFLGRNANGHGILWRMNGYTPQRISNHAFEVAVQGYERIDDASSYVYQAGGALFYRIDFPSARSGRGATWVYDSSTGAMHERTWLRPSNGLEYGDRARSHMFCFGKHLVGDSRSDTIFEMSSDYATDNGDPILRERVTPDVADGGNWTYYSQLRLLADVGMGLDGSEVPDSNPQCSLQVSNDGGRTWGSERRKSLGKRGAFRTQLRWPRLGRSQNRAFRWTTTSAAFVALISADLDAHA